MSTGIHLSDRRQRVGLQSFNGATGCDTNRGPFADLRFGKPRDDSPDFPLVAAPTGPRPDPVPAGLCVRGCPSKAEALGLCGAHFFRRKS